MKDRTKNKPTPKQNKWNDPFYARSKCSGSGEYHKFYSKWLRMKVKKSPFIKTVIS